MKWSDAVCCAGAGGFTAPGNCEDPKLYCTGVAQPACLHTRHIHLSIQRRSLGPATLWTVSFRLCGGRYYNTKGLNCPPNAKQFSTTLKSGSKIGHTRIGLLILKIISFVFLRKSIFSQLWIRVEKQFPEDRKWFPRPFFLDKMKLTLVYKKGTRFLFQATEVLFLKVRKMP